MSSAMPQHVIAHHFDARITGLLRDRWPHYPVIQVDAARSWQLPAETSVLLSGPSTVWSGAPSGLPDNWPRDLRWVQIPGAGADAYPKWLLEHHLVTTGRGLNSAPIAEFAMANVLAQAKRIPAAWIRRHEDWRKVTMDTVAGKVLGLLGIGSVGTEIARRALAFEMRVIAFRQSADKPMLDGVTRAASLDDLLGAADHLVLAAPYTPDTHHIIGRAALAKVKRGVHLINVARGGLIDQDALLEALDSGQVGVASLDVTEPEPLPANHPLYTHPQVNLSPHVAWNSPGTLDRLVQKFNENLARLIAGHPLIDVANEKSLA
jgi:phosphoglycerate dehydrogenase-like enzyme